MAQDLGIQLGDDMEDTQHGRFLMFDLGEEVFGLEISYVTEIIGMQPISGLPETPDYIRGIVNLRGKIIPVIDMRLKFKKSSIDYTDRTCIIVIDTGLFSVGLIVDSVAEVLALSDDQIVPPPDTRTGIQNRYIKGIGKTEERVALLLDCEKLFSEEENDVINNTKDERVLS
jgi:purine-binding chemotaxis protein CheW